MTKKEKATIAEGLRRIIGDLAVIAGLFEESEAATRSRGSPAEAESQKETPPPEPEKAAPPESEITYEDVRAVLAEKSRTGYRAEVKALITRHGVRQLSEITDPAEYARMLAEAREIGKADADG